MDVRERLQPTLGEVAFDDFYRAQLHSLATLATALTGSRETGSDLAHEALLRAFRAWPKVSALDRPGGWVRRVLINLAIDEHRRSGREQRALVRVTNEPAPAGTVERPDESFWRAVRDLPERQRAVVALYYVEDLPVAAIAETLDVRPGTVKAALFDARHTLAAVLGAARVSDGGTRDAGVNDDAER